MQHATSVHDTQPQISNINLPSAKSHPYPSIIFEADISYSFNKEPSALRDDPCFTIVPSHGMYNRISKLSVKHLVSNQQQLLNNHQEYSFIYPSFIFDVHVSSSFNKTFHCVVTTIAGCNMQGSLLIGESKKKCCNDSHSRLSDLVV